MAYYGGIWKTDNVLVELKIKDEQIILERTRGKKQTKKRIMLDVDKMSELIKGIVMAYRDEPTTQVTNRIPIGFVDGGFGLLRLEWGPYWFGSKNALMVTANVGQCLAIEQEDLYSFCYWLLGQWMSIQGVQRIDLA